ncbi:hypothetical protein [Pseudobacteroides cellulosolvens]|uniref:Uncharacterized protein n=1 Tax=Pseudobacteroides cellulosolvens ATCC 35603 = DSM 2933 TaxID=398512 RepID=A0A0L6JGM0_9FIRM|nr:hypothetical protein [Pseudobacteroides cellulosolvens]KNY24854.1 hypothetical protein Bccel_0111 [Pseudobacteroides cellulosolvens ATCC 35603 = DSM 2933]
MNQFLTPEVVSLIITAVIVPALVKGIKLAGKALENKIGNDKFDKYIVIAEDAVETAVVSVGQTVVDTLKKNGEFDQAAKEEVFTQAKQLAVNIMGYAARNELAKLYGDLDAWLDNKIEYYVKKTK